MKRLVIILSLLTALFIFFPTIKAYASCNATRFVIEDEISMEELGVIYTDSSTRRGENKEVCLQGTFAGLKYQYLYRCDKTGRFEFVKKFKTPQKGCKWGEIH